MQSIIYVVGSLFLCCFSFTIQAQQVGIRVANPQEALDVNGNIQLNGAIKVNGNAGLAGQVLKSTGTGLAWDNLVVTTPMARWQVFATPVNGASWPVPAGVAEVMVEIWGAGGGGSSSVDGTGGGGGGGAYSSAIINVSNVSSLSVYVGSGGSGVSLGTGLAGSESEVRWTRFAVAYKIQSAGGLGATQDAAGAGGPIAPGITIVPSDISMFQLPGQAGSPVRSFHTVASSGIFYRRVYGAEGGAAYQFADYVKPGSNYGFDPTNPSTAASSLSSNSRNIVLPGFGGSSNRRAGDTGADGSNGLVIIRW
jgi:hypothetical protein